MRFWGFACVLCTWLVMLACATAGSYQRGVEYDQAGQHRRAVSEFNKAIAWDPKHPAPRNGRALAYMNLGEYENALKDLDEAIRLDPNYYLAYYNRGTLYGAKLQDHVRAVQDFDKCLELNDQYPSAYQSRGAAYRAMGNSERARQDWRKACELGLSQGCASVEGLDSPRAAVYDACLEVKTEEAAKDGQPDPELVAHYYCTIVAKECVKRPEGQLCRKARARYGLGE